jgi:hypothetical protein
MMNRTCTAGISIPAFLNTLAGVPVSSVIFTTQLKNLDGTMVISTDGSVQTVSILDSTYQGQAGTNTLVSNMSGVGNADSVCATSPGTPLTSFAPGGTTYNVFGIGNVPRCRPPQFP